MSPPKWWKIKVWYRRAQTLGLLWAYPTGFHETISDVGFEYMMVIVCLFSVSIFSSKGYLSHGSKKKKIWFGIPKLRNSKASFQWQKVKVKVAQSCPTLCDSIDLIVHGIAQARILEWVAFPFSRGPSQPRDRTQVSHIAGGFFTSLASGEAHQATCRILVPWPGIKLMCPAVGAES